MGWRGRLEINLRPSCDLSHADAGTQLRAKCVKVHRVGLISVAGEEEEDEEEEQDEEEEEGPMALWL